LLYAICDSDVWSLERARRQYPWIKTFERYDDVLSDPATDAIVIATPTSTHYALARAALEAGKHVLVEKPLAERSEECCELIACAESHDLILMVGHTFLFSPPVQHLKHLVESGELGDLYYLYASRLNLGIMRPDVNVLWDLGPHDISIVLHLVDDLPVAVTARGFPYIRPDVEVVAFVTLEFASGVCAHLHVSWLDPNKVRKMTVVGSRRMAVYDDINPDLTIQIYDKGVDVDRPDSLVDTYGEFKMVIRSGDLFVPRMPAVEPLRQECENFLRSIAGLEPCRSDGRAGLAVVSVLEGAEYSMRRGGIKVTLLKQGGWVA
jgi:predicted dehydrogenase